MFVAELVVVAWLEESVDHRDDHRRREQSEFKFQVVCDWSDKILRIPLAKFGHS